MRAPVFALLGASLMLSACAEQQMSATTEQALDRYGSKAQFNPFRPLKPDFTAQPAGEYRLVPGRWYEGRGQIKHYGWKRVPLE